MYNVNKMSRQSFLQETEQETEQDNRYGFPQEKRYGFPQEKSNLYDLETDNGSVKLRNPSIRRRIHNINFEDFELPQIVQPQPQFTSDPPLQFTSEPPLASALVSPLASPSKVKYTPPALVDPNKRLTSPDFCIFAPVDIVSKTLVLS